MGNGWIVGSDENISERRFKILYELLLALPNSQTVLASNDPKTAALFQKWTGFTQETLENAWKAEGFVKDEKGHWNRAGGGAVTTSCEGLVMSVFGLIERYNMGRRAGLATAFNLANVDKNSGKEKTDPVGWHWFRDYYDIPDSPQPGDLFQIGTLIDYKQWSLKHVGMIVRWEDTDNGIKWETVEAGQGGPGSAFDSMTRKALRLLSTSTQKEPKRMLMGWLNIDEHFG